MMASHRPADTPPPPPPDAPAEAAPPAAAPTGLTTLPPSSFLVGFDWVLSFGVLALAFLIASFAVRNSDFWMHLATGRLLAEGQYWFGTDPFSYTGEGRTWVNHSWLFDGLLYLLYTAGNGPAVVIAKAVVVALTAGLLLLARKPGQSVFPAVVCVGLALVAAAPRLLLQPALVSFLFLAALMFLLIRVPRRPGSWRFPILVAVLLCLWANCDRWFLLGPAALLLYTVGQYVRADEGEDVSTLWKALGIGVLATLLNPHHVLVWMPPPELTDGKLAEVLRRDPEFADVFRGAFTPGAIDFTGERANPANLYALLGLVALVLVGFFVNRRQVSVGLALVWAGSLVLALVHLRAVPFLAIVSAPVAAVNLAAAGRRLADTPMPDGTVRVLHAFRAGGRALVGLAGLLAIALTYPGWLQPFDAQRRWAWDVEPSPSLVRAAEQVHQWHTSEILPPDARLLNLQPDFASYLAWYAPKTKSFIDHRLAFHRAELAEYASLRRNLNYIDPRKRSQDLFDLPEFLSRYGITYAVYAPARPDNRVMLANLWGTGDADPLADPEWVMWDVQGRATTFGWTPQKTIRKSAFNRLRFDPLGAAYADPKPLPAPPDPLPPPVIPTDVWERFLVPPPTPPVDAQEAVVHLLYRRTLLDRSQARQQQVLWAVHQLAGSRLMTPALTLWAGIQRNPRAGLIVTVFPQDATAASMLGVRAARRAVHASPDHPDGYYYLAEAYGDVGFATIDDLKDVITTVSLARARVRVPDDPTQLAPTFDVVDLSGKLYGAHNQGAPPRLDLAVDALRLALTYLRYDLETREARLAGLPADARDAAELEVERRRRDLNTLEKDFKAKEADVQRNYNQYVLTAASQVAPLDRAAVARRYGLVLEAVGELRKAQEQFQKQLGDRKNPSLPPAELATHLAEHAELIELLWYAGRVEEAARILDTVDSEETLQIMETPAVRQEYARVRQRAMMLLFPDPRRRRASPYDADPAAHFRALRRATAMIVGDFQRAVNVQAREAEAVRQQLTEYRAKMFPAGIPDPAGLPDLGTLQLDMMARPALSAVTFARMKQMEKVLTVRALAKGLADLQVALGLTYLEWGEVERAVPHLRQARDAPGWAEELPSQRLAQGLLRAIQGAAADRGGRP